VLLLFSLASRHVLVCHGLLEALDGVLHFLLPRLRLLLLLDDLRTFGLVDALELAVLACQLALYVLQRLDLLFFLVGTFFKLGLLGESIVEASVEDLDLLLSLLCLALCLLQAFLKILEESSLLISGIVIGSIGL